MTLGPLSGIGMPVMDPFIIESDDCSNATLDPGATCDVTFSFRPALDAPFGPVEQEIEVPVVDPVDANAVVVLSGSVSRDVDLSATLEISTNPDPDSLGEIVYSLEVANNGGRPATGVRIVLSTEATNDLGVIKAIECLIDGVPDPNCFSDDSEEWFIPSFEGGSRAVATVTVGLLATSCRFVRGTVLVYENASSPTEPAAEASAREELPTCSGIIDPNSEEDNCICGLCIGLLAANRDVDVETLRDFRDQYLSRFALGRRVIDFYYAISPGLADHLRRNRVARWAVGKVASLTAMVIRSPLTTLAVLFALLVSVRVSRRYRSVHQLRRAGRQVG